jgi:hypothetical protein
VVEESDGVFGVPIRPTGDIPPLLGKFVRYLLTKGITTPDIFALDNASDKELINLRKSILVGVCHAASLRLR